MTIANPDYVPASVILERFPWVTRQKLRLAGAKGIVHRQPSDTHGKRFGYDPITAKAWAEKRRKRLILPAGKYRFKDKRGRRWIALRVLPERFGLDPKTYMKWHRVGCSILGRAKPALRRDIYLRQPNRTIRQTFFGDYDFIKRYLAKHRELSAASITSEIPAGWGTLEQAHETGISPFRLRWLIKEEKVQRKWFHRPVGSDGVTRKMIVLMDDVRKYTNEMLPETLSYSGLIVSHETGVSIGALKHLFEVGRLTFMEKKLALHPLGQIRYQWHFLKTEIDEHKPRLDQRSKLGRRQYWIDRKDFYPNLEALDICGCTSFELWKWRPISAGGLGQPCPYLFDDAGRNRCISCKDGGRTYGSKYPNVPLYSGDDLRLIGAGKKGLKEPAPAPAPPPDADLSSLQSTVNEIKIVTVETNSTTGRIEKKISAAKDKAAKPADGPGPNLSFWWGGKCESLQPLDWKLVDFIWRQPGRSAEIQNAIDAALDGQGSSDAMSARKRRINDVLLKIKSGLTIRTKLGRLVID